MTVEDEIQAFLSANGRSKVSDIANGVDYSPGYVRQNAKEMVTDGTIQGEKTPRQIPAAIINGEFEVLSNSKDELLNVVRKHAPHLVGRAKGLSANQIQNLIAEDLADRTLAFTQEVWEFW